MNPRARAALARYRAGHATAAQVALALNGNGVPGPRSTWASYGSGAARLAPWSAPDVEAVAGPPGANAALERAADAEGRLARLVRILTRDLARSSSAWKRAMGAAILREAVAPAESGASDASSDPVPSPAAFYGA